MNTQKPELTWGNKSPCQRVEPRTLQEDVYLSYHADPRVSEQDLCDNRLIFGDNLLALKALEPEFGGRIKCIFIDPPYNTGAAFAQYDDGIAHGLWLTMLRDRLEPLRSLLTQDGSLWIVLDDHEVHYAKVLCDELFGRANFVSTIIWQKKYTQANDAAFFSDNHDYILVYARDKTQFRLNKLGRSEQLNAAYKNPDNDPRGPWKSTPLHAKSGNNPDFCHTFQNGISWRPPAGTFPRFSAATLMKMESRNEIWFGKRGKSVPARKTFLSEVAVGVVPRSLWLCEEVGHNHEAKTEVRAFNASDPFATPKPERLIERVLQLATDPGDWVLDSFAGSGTTGAVAHKMGRQWIMVEVGEHCHTHILPRLRAVIDGQDAGGVTESTAWQGGGGFRYYAVTPSS